MKDEKAYQDEQWNDLPLPDADKAWQKMELLLDEDKKRRRLLPFWFWRYGGLALLLVGLAVGGWYWWQAGSTTDAGAQQESVKSRTATSTPPSDPAASGQPKTSRSASTKENKPNHQTTIEALPQPQETPDLPAKQMGEKKEPNNIGLTAKVGGRTKVKSTASSAQIDRRKTNNRVAQQTSNVKQTPTSPELTGVPPKEKQASITAPKDSVAKKDTVGTKAAEPVASAAPEQNKKQKKKAAFEFSAGIGLQQAIPLKQQASSAFNYNGKRSKVADLIPSVYLRLQRGRWYAQAEFQYAVPQPVEHFSFSQKTTYDATAFNVNVERFSIQKIYYHQLPFSVNYHVLPNWSIGAGAMYNMLAGAVTEQEVQSRNVQTGAEATTRNLAPIRGYKDSFLYKSTAGILVQTDYHWKRFSLGMRFTQDLQPFIKYTTPDGIVMDEKNRVLQAILRFRLF
jgi:hypothetical protein